MDGWMDGRYTFMLLLAFWFIGLMAVKEVGENELKDTVALPLPHFILFSLEASENLARWPKPNLRSFGPFVLIVLFSLKFFSATSRAKVYHAVEYVQTRSMTSAYR
jgi:hypothetical protein